MHRTNQSTLVLISTGILVMSFSSAQANANWWDKAVSVIESLGGKEVIEEVIKDNLGEDALNLEDIDTAFKQALTIGSENVVAMLGKVDGFNTNPRAHISLPKNLKKVRKVLKAVGLTSYVDDLELKLNRAAEAATPVARQIFVDSISTMTFKDVKAIYEGPEDSATNYFEAKMNVSLREKMRPIIDESLKKVGAINTYDQMIKQYKDIPFVPDIKADLSEHVLDKTLEAIFHYIAQEEAAIRNDPAKQTGELLKKVFGTK